MRQLALFVVLDVCFLGTLVGMSSCLPQSKLAYVSDWIMECKRSGTAQQAMPVLVAAMFILIVLWQLDWMVRVSCSKEQPHSLPAPAPHPFLVQGPPPENETTTQESAAPPTDGFNTAVISCKLAAVLGIIFVFMYDHQYPTERRGFVYTHYYGVVLVCIGLAGLMQITWWNLDQVMNNHTLYRDVHSPHIDALEERSFFVGDVFLLVVTVVFFTSTLLANSDSTGSMHNSAVISEFIVLGLLWTQLMYLFFKCWTLEAFGPIELPNNAHRLAVAFVVLMTPYAVMQSM